MIFKNFESTDIVAGRINKVSSGFWVDGNYAVTQSTFTTGMQGLKLKIFSKRMLLIASSRSDSSCLLYSVFLL